MGSTDSSPPQWQSRTKPELDDSSFSVTRRPPPAEPLSLPQKDVLVVLVVVGERSSQESKPLLAIELVSVDGRERLLLRFLRLCGLVHGFFQWMVSLMQQLT